MRTEAVRPPMIAERKGIVSIPELYQLYWLWKETGQRLKEEDLQKAAEELEPLLSSLLQKRAFRFLWCREDSYREIEPGDLPQAANSSYSNPDMGLKVFCSEPLSVATTLVGDRTSLGAIQAKQAEIRAFGPQAYPLSDSKGFGIYRLPDKELTDRWTACAFDPEVWLDVASERNENTFHLNVKFLGLKANEPFAFVFYIKAKKGLVGHESYLPKSLRRYQGEAQPVFFDDIKIFTNINSKMELIPLAGEGCFWDTEFLLAYEIPPNIDLISFKVISSS